MPRFVDLAVPGPFKHGLQYILPPEIERSDESLLGCRAWVPLGKRTVVGVIVACSHEAQHSADKMKSLIEVIDETALFDSDSRRLLEFVSQYYHAPLGEVYFTALPKLLCEGKPLFGKREAQKIKASDPPSMVELGLVPAETVLATLRNSRSANLIQTGDGYESPPLSPFKDLTPALKLNAAQKEIVEAIRPDLNIFHIHLLEGVTGSGKTEVYLELAQAQVEAGKTVLVLVPEIGLTPQTIERFQARFGALVKTYHSGLSEGEKRRIWRESLSGEARIVIGTRSSIFLPLKNLGLIVIDEEHDASYKQQNGVRYSAKSVAMMRAREASCAVILGSATPSVESLYFAGQNRYRHHHLKAQAKGGKKAQIQLIDMRAHQQTGGLSRPLLNAMQQHLEAGHQVLIFLNRRGFAPILMCSACSKPVQCPACDMAYTLHQRPALLMCHHCGKTSRTPKACPACQISPAHWVSVGTGTEQIEAVLEAEFSNRCIVRLDQDVTREKGSFEKKLQQIHTGEAEIIIGTQMLAKGHDFTHITLVGIVDLDYGFFAPDFRGIERMGQLLIQVAGRAGRALLPGEVLIQTRVPEHALLLTLLKEGYSAFAHALLIDREAGQWPPFQYIAIFRAEHADEARVLSFLNAVKQNLLQPGLRVLGPIFSSLRKKAGYYRAQLLLESPKRASLHQALSQLEAWIVTQKALPRYSIDVDPLDVM